MKDLILRVVSSGTHDLQIDNSIPLRLDISAVQNTDIGKSYGIGSQTFVLPGTKANNQFFQHAYDVGAEDVPAMYNDVEAYILLDGEQVLEGRMHLMEIMTDDDGAISYRVQIEDTSINFITALEDKLIADADFSAFEHTCSINTIKDGWLPNSHTSSLLSGSVFYPLADYGSDNPEAYPVLPRMQLSGSGNNFDTSVVSPGVIDHVRGGVFLSQLQPAIRVRELFDVIFEQAGFNYTSSLLDSADFDNVYILPKSRDENGPVPSGSTGDNTAKIFANASPTYSGSSDFGFTVPYDNNTIWDGYDTNDNFDTSSFEYTTPEFGTYSIDASVYFSGPNTLLRDASLTLSLVLGTGKVLAESTVEYKAADALNPLYKIQTVSYTGFINPSNNVKLSASVSVGSGTGNASIYIPGYSLNQNSFFHVTQAPELINGATINMADQFDSKTKSIDLVRDILKQFNAVMVPLPGNPRTLEIENYNTWYDNGREVEWTDKIDNAQKIAIKNPVVEQPREIKISNAEDEDRFSRLAIDDEPNFQYGTIRILNTSNLTSGEVNIETSTIAPVVLGSIIQSGSVDSDNNPTFNLSGTQFVIPHLYKFDNGQQTAYKFKPRIGYKVANRPCTGAATGGIRETIFIASSQYSTSATSSFATLSNTNTLPVTSASKDLHFDNAYPDLVPVSLSPNEAETAYETYYDEYIQSLYWDEGRKIVASIYFTPEEYRDIRLNDNIIIKNQKYTINKISGYNLQEPDVVEVELIKRFTGYTTVTPGPEPPEFTSGWIFEAGESSGIFAGFTGFHSGSFLSGSEDLAQHGTGVTPTVATIAMEGYVTEPPFVTTSSGGRALLGFGDAAKYALTQFDYIEDSGRFTMGFTTSSADPATDNPAGTGTISLSGILQLSGSTQTSTWSGDFTSLTGTTPYPTPEAVGEITVSGAVTSLQSGSKYIIHLN